MVDFDQAAQSAAQESRQTLEIIQKEVGKSAVELIAQLYTNIHASIEQKKRVNETAQFIKVMEKGSDVACLIPTEDVARDVMNGNLREEDAVRKIAESVPKALKQGESLKNISFNENKSNLFAEAINRDINKEILETIPHYDVPNTDVSLVARCMVGDADSFLIANNNARLLKMLPREAIECAIKRLQKEEPVVRSMGSILGHEDDDKMLVVTNKSGKYGAAAIFVNRNIREELYKRLGDYYVLPSSIHEVIAVKADESPSAIELDKMVKEINKEVLDPKDILSDHAFFVGADLQIRLASASKEMKEVTQTAKQVMHL